MTTLTLVPFTPDSPCFHQVARLLHTTWSFNYADTAAAATKISRHAEYPGFKGIAALDGAQVVGLNYGYTNLPGQWWYDQIARVVGARIAQRQLYEAFAFTELAITPQWRGQGIATRLHNALLAGLPHQRAVLSTQLWNMPARTLYSRLGWQTLVHHMRFQSVGEEFTILERVL